MNRSQLRRLRGTARAQTSLLGLLALLAIAFSVVPANPHVAAQDDSVITPFVPVEGEVNGISETWTFTGHTGEPLSFHAEALTGNVDPVLTIRDESGRVLIQNDDYNYPDSGDALLEAITMPTLGTFRVTVSSFGGSAGEFRLTMLPGYARVDRNVTFEDVGDWTAVPDSATLEATDDDALQVTLPTGEPLALVAETSASAVGDFYAQARVSALTGANWAVGLAFRAREDGSHYRYLVNARGEWQFAVQTPDGVRMIRDWVRHPAIRAGVTDFRLAVMAMGSGFDLIYDNTVLGRESDVALAEAGSIALVASRAGGAEAITATFAGLDVTVPFDVDGAGVIPQTLIVADPRWMVQELTRRRLVPGHGQLVLNLAESFAEFSRPGVTVVPLASNVQFTNLAFGTTIYANSAQGAPGGCGLILRSTAEDRYVLAYIDGQGGYGLSQRDGDTFSDGLFAERTAWDTSAGHHLLVIAGGDRVQYFVDGAYVGAIDSEEVTGTIGEAVVNFESVYTSCRFLNTWVWRWE